MRHIAIIALLGTTFASTAFAGPAPANATDNDSDGAYVVTDLNGDGSVTDADFVIAGPGATNKATFESIYGKLDCDDTNGAVNPSAPETYFSNGRSDAIDSNCDGSSPDFVVTDGVLARWQSSYGSNFSFVTMEKERARCTTASQCTVNDGTGSYDLTDGYMFVDHVKGSWVIGTAITSPTRNPDGLREVMTVAEDSVFVDLRTARRPRGVGSSWVTARIAEAQAAQTGVDADQDDRLDGLESNVAENRQATEEVLDYAEGQVARLDRRNGEFEDALEVERKRNDAQDGRLDTLEHSDRQQDDAIAVNSGTAPLIEGYAGAGLTVGTPVVDGGDQIRNAAGGGLVVGGNVGADLPSARVNAYGEAMIGGDGGSSAMTGLGVGGEALFQVNGGDFHIGPTCGYSRRNSQTSSLEVAVVGDAVRCGPGMAIELGPDNTAGHGVVVIRPTVGVENAHLATSPVSDRWGFSGGLTVTVGGGVGARQ